MSEDFTQDALERFLAEAKGKLYIRGSARVVSVGEETFVKFSEVLDPNVFVVSEPE